MLDFSSEPDLASVFRPEVRDEIVIVPQAAPQRLARALIMAARYSIQLASDSLDQWWSSASSLDRVRLILCLSRALLHIDSTAAQRLGDPRWRDALGVPLWLATFVMSRRLRRRLQAASTLRAWSSDWRTWRLWCKRHSLPSFNPTPIQFDQFMRDFAPTHKLSTTRRLGASLTAMHTAAGLPDPLNNPLLREIWRGVLRPAHRSERGSTKRMDDDRRLLKKKRATGLTRSLLECTLDGIGTTRRIDLRDAALLAVAYDMLGRRSEIAKIEIADITRDPDGSGTLRIGLSNIGKKVGSVEIYLREDTMNRISAWTARAGLTSGVLFRSLSHYTADPKTRSLPPIQASEILRIFRRRVKAVKPAIAPGISGDSARVGGAQDLGEAGISDSAIINAGSWKKSSKRRPTT